MVVPPYLEFVAAETLHALSKRHAFLPVLFFPGSQSTDAKGPKTDSM